MQINNYLRNEIKESARGKFIKLRQLNPFPIDSQHIHAIYMSLVPVEIANAIKTLVQEKAYGWLEQNRRGELYIIQQDENEVTRRKEIVFDFGTAKPSVNSWTEHHKAEVRADHPMHDTLFAWAKECKRVDNEIHRCNNFIESLARACNTPGQWNTVFPDFINMLPPQVAAELSNMKKRSPVPRTLDMSFVREHRTFVAEKLATALLLPEDPPKIWVS